MTRAAGRILTVPRHALQRVVQPRAAAASDVTTPLQSAWLKLINQPSLSHSQVSAYAVDLNTHQVLAAINPNTRLTPGSVTKLFTSAAALETLGGQYRYTTRVMIPSTPSGTPGPIYLDGGGDPWLEANGHADLEALAKQVASQVPDATKVIGVGQSFSGPGYGIGWPLGMLPQNYAAATSGLMAERSEVAVYVLGGLTPGAAPTVSYKFNGPAQDPNYFTVDNHATTTEPGSATTIKVTRLLGTNTLKIIGHIAAKSTAGPFVLSVGNPAQFAAALFESALTQDGVHFSQPATSARNAPAGLTTIARHVSKPLAHLLQLQNQFSINQMAENLYRAAGHNGSLSSAAETVTALDHNAQIPAGNVQVDGSGLSPLDQMSARDVVQLLSYASRQPWFSTFQSSLMQLNNPHGCGFLCPPTWRFPMPTGTGLWVKTGNLANQWNIAGYARTQNGHLVAFAILDDGTPTSANDGSNSPIFQMMGDVVDWPRPAVTNGSTRAFAGGILPNAVRPIVAALPNLNGATMSLAVVNVRTGQLLYQQNGQVLTRAGLAPRVVLAAGSLAHLGSTIPGVRLIAHGAIQQGVLNGDLVIESQDANLTALQIKRLANQVKEARIIAVNGPIEYESARPSSASIDARRFPPSLPWNAIGHGWAAPRSSLSFNLDQAQLTVTAGRVGDPAMVQLDPSYPMIHLSSRVTTVGSNNVPAIRMYPNFTTGSMVISGTVPAGYWGRVAVSLPHPGLYAALALQNQLTSDGIQIHGTPQATTGAASGALVGSSPATSVTQLVHQSLTVPSMLPSEMLLTALGKNASVAITPLTQGLATDVKDWTGAGLENYLTADGLGHVLTVEFHRPADRPMVTWLSHHVWIGKAPEQEEMLAYVHGPGNTVYGVAALISGLPWNGRLSPQAFFIPDP
nr:D-alanyl-D-alanine carboxypeptidase/D-alanyl-D-alanine-endopeptidase [Sulfobacillus harzensis]